MGEPLQGPVTEGTLQTGHRGDTSIGGAPQSGGGPTTPAVVRASASVATGGDGGVRFRRRGLTRYPGSPATRPMAPGLHPDAAPAVLDADRLQALASTALLDTPPEDEFDRLTALTARVSGAPVSLVALVDRDRSYFKSAHGVPEVPPGRTVPLSHSLCQHVVGSGAPLVIDDARAHPLVRDNGGVTDLGVGAYLGVPVRAPSGHVVGSLCAIDTGARAWTADDQTSLVSLAASVEGEIALRAELAERQAAEALARAEADALEAVVGVNAQLAAELDPDRLVQAVVEAGVATTGATMGAFFYRSTDHGTGGESAAGESAAGEGDEGGDSVLFAATGVPASVVSRFSVFHNTPESAAAFSAAMHAGDLHADPALSWASRLVDGLVEVRSVAGVPVTDAAGRQTGTLLFGHPDADVFDARARRGALAIADQAAIALQNARLHRALDESERRHRAVLAGLSDVVFQTDAGGRYTYLNAAWADRTGHAVEASLGRSFLDFAAAGDADALAAQSAAAAVRATPGAPAWRRPTPPRPTSRWPAPTGPSGTSRSGAAPRSAPAGCTPARPARSPTSPTGSATTPSARPAKRPRPPAGPPRRPAWRPSGWPGSRARSWPT